MPSETFTADIALTEGRVAKVTRVIHTEGTVTRTERTVDSPLTGDEAIELSNWLDNPALTPPSFVI